jgi:hypothetical protein
MSQLCRVNQDLDERSGLLGVIEMNGVKKKIILQNNTFVKNPVFCIPS